MCIDSMVSIGMKSSSIKYWKCHFLLIIKFSEINSYCTLTIVDTKCKTFVQFKYTLRKFFLSENSIYNLAVFFQVTRFMYINMSILIVYMYYKLYSYWPINNTILLLLIFTNNLTGATVNCWFLLTFLLWVLILLFTNYCFNFSFTVHQYSCLYNAYVI